MINQNQKIAGVPVEMTERSQQELSVAVAAVKSAQSGKIA
jgi:hypothetical protein